MTKQQFDSMLAKLESGKSEVGIGNIREITALLRKVFSAKYDTFSGLIESFDEKELPPALQKKLAAYKPNKKKK